MSRNDKALLEKYSMCSKKCKIVCLYVTILNLFCMYNRFTVVLTTLQQQKVPYNPIL